MPETRQSLSMEVHADLDACIDVLLDFAAYPQWSGPITEANVLERDANGRGTLVAFALDMTIRTVRYTLRYEYQLPERATWTLHEGDVASIEGSYEFHPIATGGTEATCTQAIDPGFWVPGPIRRMAERQGLRDSITDFKREVERRCSSR